MHLSLYFYCIFRKCFFICGTGRQPIQRDKTINDNYYLPTLMH